MKTVIEKLGFKVGMSGWVIGCPTELSDVITLHADIPSPQPDLIIVFVKAIENVEAALTSIQPHYARGHLLWFAYPKKSGAIKTDITRDKGWTVLHESDLLPVTQVSIDETWSALRFRYRDEIKTLTRKSDYPGQQAAA